VRHGLPELDFGIARTGIVFFSAAETDAADAKIVAIAVAQNSRLD
jgi:hypothetical protein